VVEGSTCERDEESEQCDAPGEDDVTYYDTEKDRRDEGRRAEAVSVGENAEFSRNALC